MKEQAFEKVQNLSLSAFHFAVKHQAKLKKSFPKKGALRAACTASHRFHFLKWLMMRSSVTFSAFSAANTLYDMWYVWLVGCPTTYNVFAIRPPVEHQRWLVVGDGEPIAFFKREKQSLSSLLLSQT